MAMQLRTVIAVGLALAAAPAVADWQPYSGDRLQVRAGAALERFRDDVPATTRYFDDAYGYAIWPTITRVGFGFGGAYGKGIVVEADAAVAESAYWQFTSGIQAGAKGFSLIIFFRDKQALDDFRTGAIQFMGQAGVDLATAGISGTPGYSDGVAVFALTRLGLMGEFTVSGVKFNTRPLATPPAD